MRRLALAPLALVPLVALLPGCSSTRTVTSTTTASGNQQQLDPQVLRRAVDLFADRVVNRTSSLADEIDRQLPDADTHRRTLTWRLRAAQTAFNAEHNPNTLVALIGLWYWTAAAVGHLSTDKVQHDLGPTAETTIAAATAMRTEAEVLAARSLPPAVHDKLKADIDDSVGNGEMFAVDSVETAAVMDQFLSATRLEKLLAIPLAPFELFGGVSDSGKALGEMSVTANRAIDLAEKYPQILQWRMSLLLLDVERLGTVKQVQQDIGRITDLVERLPTEMRTQATALLEDSVPVQIEAQRTLQEVTAAGTSLAEMARSTNEALQELDRFIAGLKKPADPSQPPSPPGEPFRVMDYAETATALTGMLHELRGAIADLQQPALAAKAQAAAEAATEAAAARAQGVADSTVDRIAWRAVQVIGVAFLAGLALILVARWKRA